MKINFNSPDAQDPQQRRGMKVPYVPGKRRAALWRWYLVLLVALAPLVYFAWTMVTELLVINAPGYVQLSVLTVNSPQKGVVQAVLPDPGEAVKPGQLLAVLRNPELPEELSLVNSELNGLTAARPDRVTGQEAARSLTGRKVDLAQKSLAFQEDVLNRVKYLFSQGAAPIAELRQARNGVRQAQAHLLTVQAEQDNLRRQETTIAPSERDLTARIAVLRARREALRDRQKQLKIRSPLAGTLAEVLVQATETVAPGTALMRIVNPDKVLIRAFFRPKYFPDLKKSATAILTFDDGTRLKARITDNPVLTARLPAAYTSGMSSRRQAVMVRLESISRLPERYRIPGMPLQVRLCRGFWECFF